MNHYLPVFSLILRSYEKYIQSSSNFSNINQPIEPSSLFSNTNPTIMKLFTLAITLLSSATSVLSIPVTDNELVVRGGPDYCETSQVIIAQRYETTKTDILYSAHCECDSCDYSVRASVALLIIRPSITNLSLMSTLRSLRSIRIWSISSARSPLSTLRTAVRSITFAILAILKVCSDTGYSPLTVGQYRLPWYTEGWCKQKGDDNNKAYFPSCQ